MVDSRHRRRHRHNSSYFPLTRGQAPPLFETSEASLGIDQRELRWRRNNERSGERCGLAQSQLSITSARRQVQDQIIERPPNNVLKKLLYDGGYDWTAPNHRGVIVDKKTDRHDFDPVSFNRDKLFVIFRNGWFRIDDPHL